MKSERLLGAIGEIDDQLIDAAAKDAQKNKKPVWLRWGSVAACLALFAVAFGCFQPFRQQKKPVLAMTAYAMGADGQLTAAIMEKSGRPVVLSKMDLGNGFEGFLFSIPAFDADALSTVTYLSSAETAAPPEGALNGFLQEKGMLFFYFLPAKDDTMPLSFSVRVKDDGALVDYAIRIEASEDGYAAIEENATIQTNGGVDGPMSVHIRP